VLGRDYFVDYSDSLAPNAIWQTLPGAPHNGGTVTDFATNPQRFYRIRSESFPEDFGGTGDSPMPLDFRRQCPSRRDK
jgi:hypothetical protein